MSAAGWSKVTQAEATEMYAEVRRDVLAETADQLVEWQNDADDAAVYHHGALTDTETAAHIAVRRMAKALREAATAVPAAGQDDTGTADLAQFEAVISTSNGDYGAADEYRCWKCGAIGGQDVEPKSLADLVAMASRHECLPRFDGLAPADTYAGTRGEPGQVTP